MQIITGKTEIEKYDHKGEPLFLKREDNNPSGSFKDRLIEYVWKEMHTSSKEEIVLSSSGNLALSLLYRQAKSNEPLRQNIVIFIKDNLPETKLSKLKKLTDQTGAKVLISKRPKSDATKYARHNNAFFLRNSEGKDYPKAYYPLAQEILEYAKQNQLNFGGIYICASSGTAALGMAEHLIANGDQIPVNIVQTSYINPIAKEFDQDFSPEEETIANAISDRIAKRKNKLVNAIAKTGGTGIICSNAEIDAALATLNYITENKKEFSGNAALALAGYLKKPVTNPLVIISGN